MPEFENTRNPILPPAYHVPDCEAHVMPDGQLYLYGSYDAREDQYCSGEYHVISTPDLAHWTVHETSFRGAWVPWFGEADAQVYPETQHGITPFMRKSYIRKMKRALIGRFVHRQPAGGSEGSGDTDAGRSAGHAGNTVEAPAEEKNPPLLYAPDAIEKNGKYYLYFCMADGSEGVAASGKPQGPFSDPVRLPCSGIDPAIFIDEDGQAYYYWGQFSAQGVRLNADLVSFDRENIAFDLVTEQKHFFHEGSSVRRIGDTYYYVFTDMQRGKPTALGYATGKSPLGPFTYQGIIIDNDGCDPESWNNHGSIEQFHGQWYVFYHRASRGSRLHRRLCIEPIRIEEDGRIAEVPMTSQGPGAPFAPGEEIMGYRACGLKGSVFIGADEIFEESLQNISGRDEALFRYVESDRPYTQVELTCRGAGTVEILMDSAKAGQVICEAAPDGRYHTVSGRMKCPPGKYTLTLRFRKPRGLRIAKIVLRCD